MSAKIKTLLFAFPVLFTLLTAGCERKNPVEEYGDALINSYERSKKAGAEATLKNIQTVIQAYHASNGEYPKTLKDIENLMSPPINPELYQYNPENGEVKLK